MVDDSSLILVEKAKAVVIKTLINEGFISPEQGIKFAGQYIFVFTKYSWYEQAYRFLFKTRGTDPKDGLYLDIAKIVSQDIDIDSINNKDIFKSTDLDFLREKLIEASQKEDFELAAKISTRIKELSKK